MIVPTRESLLTLSADLAAVRGIGPWLADLLGDCISDENAAVFERVELALHEICVNIVDHAYQGQPGTFTIHGVVSADRVTAEVVDHGIPFDEDAVCPPVPGIPQVGGYGLVIVKRLVDTVAYQRVNDTNRWRIEVARTPQG